MRKNHEIKLENEKKSRIDLVNELQEMMEKQRKKLKEEHQQEIDRMKQEHEIAKKKELEDLKH